MRVLVSEPNMQVVVKNGKYCNIVVVMARSIPGGVTVSVKAEGRTKEE